MRTSRQLILIGAVSVAGVLVPPAGPFASQPPPPGELIVVPSSSAPGRHAGVELRVLSSTDSPAPAQESIYVPAGYGLATARRPGAVLGGIGALWVKTSSVSNVHYVTGSIKQGQPGHDQSSAPATCAPGAERAVWVASIVVNGATLAIPISVESTRGAERALGAFKLTMCFPSPYVAASGPWSGIRFVSLSFSLLAGKQSIFTNPRRRGIYVWRMLVTPFVLNSATPNPAKTFEARARVAHPHHAGLRLRYVRKKGLVFATGRLLALGKPRPHVRIYLYGSRFGSGVFHFGTVRTRKNGRFSIRRLISERNRPRILYVGASIAEQRARCVEPPVTAAGCVDENLSPPHVFASVTIPAGR